MNDVDNFNDNEPILYVIDDHGVLRCPKCLKVLENAELTLDFIKEQLDSTFDVAIIICRHCGAMPALTQIPSDQI